MPYSYAAEYRQTYNASLTEELQKIIAQTNDLNFAQNKGEIKRLVEQGANPNKRHKYSRDSLLTDVVLKSDEPLTQCLLTHKATPNPTTGEPPLFSAKTVPIVKCLISHGADLNKILDTTNSNLLGHAIYQHRSAAIIGFFLNAGVDPNPKDCSGNTFMHDLCKDFRRDQERLLKASILLWAGLSPHERNSRGDTAFDLLAINDPSLVSYMLAMVLMVPKIKQSKYLAYAKSLPEYTVLLAYLPADQAGQVVIYLIDFLPWEDRYWDEIRAAIKYSPTAIKPKLKGERSGYVVNTPYHTNSCRLDLSLLNNVCKIINFC